MARELREGTGCGENFSPRRLRTFNSCCLRFSLLALSVFPSAFTNGRTSSPTSLLCRTMDLRGLGSKLLPRGFARHIAVGVAAKNSTATWQ